VEAEIAEAVAAGIVVEVLVVDAARAVEAIVVHAAVAAEIAVTAKYLKAKKRGAA
jgi:hypothetical protein